MKTTILILSIIFCFLIYERISGTNKICTYQCAEGQYAITIDVTDICPVSL